MDTPTTGVQARGEPTPTAKTTFDGRKVDATMRTKDHTAKPRQSALWKRAGNKNQCALFRSPPGRRLQCHSDRKLKRCEISEL